MALASWKVFVISIGLTLFSIGVYYFMGFCRTKGWLEFSEGEKVGKEEEVSDKRLEA